MKQEDYAAMWKQLWEQSFELADRRTELENQLNDVRAEMENVEQALAHIRPLAGIARENDLHGLGITDAIRAVLRGSNQRMSPADIRKALASKGFDLSGYSSPMSSVYTVLGRISGDESSSSEVIREQDESRNVFYIWRANALAQSTEITDDDIPF